MAARWADSLLNMSKLLRKPWMAVVLLGFLGCAPRPAQVPQYSFENGCYAGYMNACQGLDRFKCLEEGLKYCPKWATDFQLWLDTGKPKK